METYTLKNNALTIKVNAFGAELCSVISNKINTEYLWQADSSVWARHAPNLFPIVGKLKDGFFKYQNKTYQLPQHGFARDHEFICVEETPTSLIFELTANETILKTYPFHFSFQISYTLIENKIVQRYHVFNPDNSVLLFSVGAHPAFNCPLQQNENFEDYELVFPDKTELIAHLLVDGLITEQTTMINLKNHTLPISIALFDKDALVFSNNQINEVHLISKKTKQGVCLKSHNWPYFGIWSKKQTNQFICLEPWQGVADFENANQELTAKQGIITLESEQSFNCEFEMRFI